MSYHISLRFNPFSLLFLLLVTTNIYARPPKWAREKPMEEGYYTGIGKAAINQSDYMQIAKNKALADIISDIKVEISSTSVLHQVEKNYQLVETYQSFTKTKVQDELEGYEMVESHSDREFYWAYYRLNIADYQRIKQEKLKKAKDAAKTYLEQGIGAQQNGNIKDAMMYYNKAFDAVKEHLTEDLSVFLLEHGRVDIGSFIYTEILKIFSNLQFDTEPKGFVFQPISENEPLQLKVTYNGKAVPNLPLLTGSKGTPLKSYIEIATNAQGKTILPPNVLKVGRQQQIEVVTDLDKLLGELTQQNILRNMFSQQTDAARYTITIETKPQTAHYVETKHIDIEAMPIINLVKEKLGAHIFAFTPEPDKASIAITIDGEWLNEEFVKKYKLHKVRLGVDIAIKNVNTNSEIYRFSDSSIEAMRSGTIDDARQEALEKLESVLTDEVIPEINQLQIK